MNNETRATFSYINRNVLSLYICKSCYCEKQVDLEPKIFMVVDCVEYDVKKT